MFSSQPQTQTTDISINNDDIHDNIVRHHQKKKYYDPHHNHNYCSRRDAALILAGAVFLAAQQRPTPAVAAEQQQHQPSTSNQYNQYFFRQLQSVPTFCIVTNEGIPFHVLHKNSDTDNINNKNEEFTTTHSTTTTTSTTSSSSSLSAHGYFFLSFEAATQALQRIREQEQVQDQVQVQVPDDGNPNSSSSTSGDGGVSVSSTAKIISVPLGMALQQSLSTTPIQREVMNAKNNSNNHLPTHHHLVVSSEGRDDAKRIEKEFLERGGRNNLYNNPQNYLHQNNLNNDYEKNNKNNNSKSPSSPSQWEQPEKIPLFYIEGLTVSNGKYEPRYFTQDDLLEEYTNQHPDQKLPPTQVVNLLDLYRTAVLDDKESQVNEVSNNLVFVPASSETVPVGKELPKTAMLLPNEYYNAQQIYLVDQ